MGSIIKFPERPTDKRVPYRGKKPKDIVPDIDPKPVQVRNVEFWRRRITDASLEGTVNDIFSAFAQHSRSENKEHGGTVARIWHMDSPEEKFKDLLQDKEYFDEVFAFLQNNGGTAYFVSDIVTLVNLEMTDVKGNSHGAGIKAEVPIDPSTGIKIGGGGKVHVIRETGQSLCYDEEVILFMGYRSVYLDKVDGMRARIRSTFLGSKHGLEVRGGANYWPTMKDGYVGGDYDAVMGLDSQQSAESLPPEAIEELEIIEELGFAPCLVRDT